MAEFELALNLALVVAGFLLLIKGGDTLVNGSVGLASLYKLSPMLVGMTIVAFGTSLPELAVSVIAALDGHPDLVLGNVVGSNMANVLLILGLTALIFPVVSNRRVVRLEMPALVALSFLALALAVNAGNISRLDGSLLIGAFLLIFFIIIRRSLRPSDSSTKQSGPYADELEEITNFELTHSRAGYALMVLGGLIGVILGGRLLVTGAVFIAEDFGVSEAIIGMTVVAVGSSLPELVTSALAAMKKQPGLVLGNIVGSNMFNLLVLGLAALILPITVAASLLPIVAAMAVLTLLLMLFVYTKFTLERWEGAVFLACYAAYMGYILTGAA